MVDYEDEYWAEIYEARGDGSDQDEWPKRCPFTGEEIDEDGSDSCPDDCKHHDSAEFTGIDEEELMSTILSYPICEECTHRHLPAEDCLVCTCKE